MSSEALVDRTAVSPRFALLATIPVAVLLLGIWTALARSHIAATSCAVQPSSAKLETLAGQISNDPVRIVRFYLSSADRKVVISDYSRSTLNKPLNNSLGKDASATFCEGELLSLDIEGKRVFTKDTSPTSLLLIGAAFALGTALVFALFAYGKKILSFPKWPNPSFHRTLRDKAAQRR